MKEKEKTLVIMTRKQWADSKRMSFMGIRIWPNFVVMCGVFYLLTATVIGYINSPKETKEEIACKDSVTSEYFFILKSNIREQSDNSLSVDDKIRIINRNGDALDKLEPNFVKRWWECRTTYMPDKEREALEKNGRWQDYQDYPNLVSSVLKRYVFPMSGTVMMEYATSMTSQEFIEYHHQLSRDSKKSPHHDSDFDNESRDPDDDAS